MLARGTLVRIKGAPNKESSGSLWMVVSLQRRHTEYGDLYLCRAIVTGRPYPWWEDEFDVAEKEQDDGSVLC